MPGESGAAQGEGCREPGNDGCVALDPDALQGDQDQRTEERRRDVNLPAQELSWYKNLAVRRLQRLRVSLLPK